MPATPTLAGELALATPCGRRRSSIAPPIKSRPAKTPTSLARLRQVRTNIVRPPSLASRAVLTGRRALLLHRAYKLLRRRLHAAQHRRRIDPEPDDDDDEAEPCSASSRQLRSGMCSFSLLVERIEQDALNRPEQIRRGEDDSVVGDYRNDGIRREGAEQHEELADEAVGAGQADRAERDDEETAPRTPASPARSRRRSRSRGCAGARRSCRRGGTAPRCETPWLIICKNAPCTPSTVSAKMPSITKPRWLTERVRDQLLDVRLHEATQRAVDDADDREREDRRRPDVTAASGKSGTAKRRKPKVPIFSMTPARITEPPVGASTCASGSHVWNGNIGTFTAKARKKAPNSQSAARGRRVQVGDDV